jgi:hypothetical protein
MLKEEIDSNNKDDIEKCGTLVDIAINKSAS